MARRDLGAVDAGPLEARWDLRDDDGDPVAAGDYRVALEVTAADGSTQGTPLPVRVSDPPPDASLPDRVDEALGGSGPVALAGVLLALSGGAWLVARRRSTDRPPDRPPHRFDAGPSARDARPEHGDQEEP